MSSYSNVVVIHEVVLFLFLLSIFFFIRFADARAKDNAAVVQKTLEDVQKEVKSLSVVDSDLQQRLKEAISTLQAELDKYQNKVAAQEVTLAELNQIVTTANDTIASLEESIEDMDKLY
jgi:peptidoglycan hydrolase CwlO-like protein